MPDPTRDALAGRRTSGLGREMGTILVDLIVPVTAYYALRAAGVDPLLALILGGLPTAAFLTFRVIRQRTLDALALFVLVILAGSVAVSFIAGSPRFLLAKEGWFTAIIGLGFLASLARARPAAFTLARALLERTPWAQPLRTASWDALWAHRRWFRQTWRVSTVLWAGGLLGDAALRVVMAYTLPVDTVPALGVGLWAVTFVGLQAAQHIYFTRVRLWRRLRETVPVHAMR